ncbi:MAG TPA: DUF188 domain-containing protein [Planctomycetota bacterium]|nr:DUF188 domain-containing protein [Planctomycetota bacterium]
MNVYVDADACPGRSEIIEVCARFGIKPVFVANKDVPGVSNNSRAVMQVVSGDFNAADDWIVEQAKPGDLVMTADLLLAQRVVKNHVEAMNFSGGPLTDDIIHDLVARREIQEQLRQMNLPAHKPVAYGKQNRSQLKANLHQWIETRRRQAQKQS